MTVLCQWCGAVNPADREWCVRCHSRLLVLSGSVEESERPEGEGVGEREGLELDEHLLERISGVEETAKRLEGAVRTLEERVVGLERSLALLDAGLQALVNLLDRHKLVREAEVVAAWEHAASSEMAREELAERLRGRRQMIVARARAADRHAAEICSRALQSAELSLLAGQPVRAAETLARALRRIPPNPELAELLGELAFEREDAAAAEGFFRLAIQWNPEDLEARVFLGTILADVGRDAEARAELERAAAQAPDAFLPHFSLGALHAAAGRRQLAVRHLRRAIACEEVPHAYFLLGLVELEGGRPGAAAAALERAVALDGEFEDAIYYLGLAYLDRGWERRARECFERVLRLDPQRLQYQEAVWLLEAKANGTPPPVEVATLLADAPRLSERGGVARLLKEVEGAASSSDHPSVLASLALLSAAAGRFRQGLAAVHRLFRLHPEGAHRLAAWTALLELLRGAHRFAAVRYWAGRLLADAQGGIETGIAAYELALAELEGGGELERAQELAHRALESMPSELRQYPLAALGRIHLACGEYALAVEYLEQAASLSASPATLTQLGLALLQAGEGDRARDVLQRARTGAARDLKTDILTHLVRVGRLSGRARKRS